MIGIIDYGIGNLRSVEKAFTAQGLEAFVSRDPDALNRADKLVLLGVGAFGYAVDSLRALGFDQLVTESAASGKPILGICVGLQMMFDEGHEFGIHRGLGLFKGQVVKFPPDLHVPHIGWNQVHIEESGVDHPLLAGLDNESFFYFVHSYYVSPGDNSCVIGTTDYGIRYATICARENVMGIQFHPEKSQNTGLRLLRNFAEL